MLLVLGVIILGMFAAFAVGSVFEKELRAAALSTCLAIIVAAPFLFTAIFDFPFRPWLTAILLLGFAIALLLVIVPFQARSPERNDVPQSRVDERDIMFARARLIPGSAEYDQYYALRPDNQRIDDKIRSMPGLSSPRAALYHPLACAVTDASFEYIGQIRHLADGPVAERPLQHSAGALTTFIKEAARHYGAHSVGITLLIDYHIYSHIGRGEGEYGAPIELAHRYAIAFTVEMKSELIRTAPAASETMEVARQYAISTQIALQLALLIRSLGYPARAHIDGNYRTIAPLVARDAGLGEIGRMGILMTPDLGPRVRLAVVTTDLPLMPDELVPDPSVIDQCRWCTKCAANCPSQSIPFGDRQEIDGAWRWRINSETCFSYWNHIGTDCGRCVAVCPYSHPDSPIHRPVRWSIRRSALIRRIAPVADDVLYGRQPKSWPAPDWVNVSAVRH